MKKSLSPTTALEVSDVEDGAIIKINETPWFPRPLGDGNYALDFVPDWVDPHETMVFVINPPVIFRAHRLTVPRPIAPHFTIDGLTVGPTQQLAGVGPVPAEVFLDEGPATRIHLDTANLGVRISLTVTNISDKPRSFTGTLEGQTVS